MALQDFIKSITSSDTTYSTLPKPSIRVIPPEEDVLDKQIRVIPPETIGINPIKIKPNEDTKPTVDKVSDPISSKQDTIKEEPKKEESKLQTIVQESIKQENNPPVQQSQSSPIVPPKEESDTSKSKVIKLKINLKKDSNISTVDDTNTEPVQQPLNIQPQVQPKKEELKPNIQPKSDPIKPKVEPKVIEEKPIEKTQEMIEEDLFNNTGTEYSKKELWLENYHKATSSRKSNPIVDRMKIGRFTITPDNKVLLLPDYDIVGKDPDDILKDKWF